MSTVTPEWAEPPLILSLDIGTSSLRAMLFDRQGRAVEGMAAREPLEIKARADGAAEADADRLLEQVWQCLDRVMAQAASLAPQIAGVATCTFVSNIVGVDGVGRAVTPLTTYGDTRAAGEVVGLRAEFDENEVHHRTGCHFHPSYLPARFRWLARAQPDLFRRVARWLSIGDYLQMKLFGRAAMSYSVASWMGLLDRQRLVWDEALLAALPVGTEQLPPLSDLDAPQCGLRAGFARRWPALRDLPWFPAIGDGATANVGSGCVSPERVALTVGTTSAVRAVVDRPLLRIPSGLWCYRVDRRRSLPGGALSEGGSVYAWMGETLQLGDPASVEEALAAQEPDAHGLTVLPFLAGERSPGWAGQARATLHGLSLATTPTDILRAGLEAVAYRIALVFQLLKPLLPEEVQVIASGGALLGSPTWLQIMTDALGRPVTVSEAGEASGRGAALLALESLGIYADVADAPDFLGSTYFPDAGRQAHYRAAMARQQALYRKLVIEEGERSEIH